MQNPSSSKKQIPQSVECCAPFNRVVFYAHHHPTRCDRFVSIVAVWQAHKCSCLQQVQNVYSFQWKLTTTTAGGWVSFCGCIIEASDRGQEVPRAYLLRVGSCFRAVEKIILQRESCFQEVQNFLTVIIEIVPKRSQVLPIVRCCCSVALQEDMFAP